MRILIFSILLFFINYAKAEECYASTKCYDARCISVVTCEGNNNQKENFGAVINHRSCTSGSLSFCKKNQL